MKTFTGMLLVITIATLPARAEEADFVAPLDAGLALDAPTVSSAELVAPDVAPVVVELPPTVPLPPDPAEDGALKADREDVGYVEPFPRDLLPAWPWVELEDGGWVSRVELHSNNALGLRLKFTGLHASSGLQLRIYDPAGSFVFNALSGAAGSAQRGWWGPTVFGDMIGVELYVPSSNDPKLVSVSITDVVYYSCECHNGFPPGAPLSCHNHVACYANWQSQWARGAALIYFISGSNCARCTGALLNRQPEDLLPLFMTANHCISTQAEADSLEIFWQWEWDTCTNPTVPTLNNLPRNNGALLLKRRSSTDWALIGLYEAVAQGANALYLGWDAGAWSSNESAASVHHPRGSHKRISFGQTGGTSNQSFGTFSADVRRVDYTNGTLEAGSSGAPVFDVGTHLVRGTHTGGQTGCPSPDIRKYFGRLDLAYDNLRYYMGDSYIASPVYVDGGVGGDPGNNGSTEQGSFGAPFNTVHEATYAVRSGDIVRIEPGNYNEQLRIWRPMTLERSGSSGTVRIGD